MNKKTIQCTHHQGQLIAILDFGSQYTQLIARRVRELGVYCEILPWNIEDNELAALSPNGIILSGGPDSVHMDAAPTAPPMVFELGCPVLGICYGMQTMARQLGGAVCAVAHREYGPAEVKICAETKLFAQIDDSVDSKGHSVLDVWMSHGDQVTEIPPDFVVIAATESAPIAAMALEARRWYGVQFHPEVTHTRQGQRILQRFIEDICGCEPRWTIPTIIYDCIAEVRAKVGREQVLLGLSGGVDSAVVAALLHQAIGDQLICVFVDNGLLRIDEATQVITTFQKHLGIHLIVVDASKRFLTALMGVSDPEQKRKIVGREFVAVFEEEAAKLPEVRWLAQGTIYPDVIESAKSKFGASQVIKTHHNVGGLPSTLKLKLLEPLRELFKDEVRKLGLELGLPYHLVYRHPFPGPGLAVRVLGEVKQEYLEILRFADKIFMEELHKAEQYEKIGQAFAVFLPIKSVGVVGDARQYEYVIALRAVETIDFMTAHAAQLPYELLMTVANRIMNEVHGVARVTYDISSKPPATIEWE